MLKFSHVKFYHDLSVGFKNLPRKPQNFGDNWPLASSYVSQATRAFLGMLPLCFTVKTVKQFKTIVIFEPGCN